MDPVTKKFYFVAISKVVEFEISVSPVINITVHHTRFIVCISLRLCFIITVLKVAISH